MPAVTDLRLHDRRCTLCQHSHPEVEPAELTGSVGEGGRNRPADVAAVQKRLNRVPPGDGGPAAPLAVDGLCGPLTKAAVLKFQRRYAPPLITDGRIDPGKNTWKKLVGLTGDAVSHPKAPAAPSAAAAVTEADARELLNIALFMSRHRIFEAMKALDVADRELSECQAVLAMNLGQRPVNLRAVYQVRKANMKELPTVDRCFKVVSEGMTVPGVRDVLRRVRKVYADMVDVIVATMFVTQAQEMADLRRFVRTTTDARMRQVFPPDGALASAPRGGWWHKDADVAHIKYNSSQLDRGDVITTLIHEMSHFVSHPTSFEVGSHHPTGLYNGAFNDTHEQAVRNSFCYEWYAFLASFKHRRGTPNDTLVLA